MIPQGIWWNIKLIVCHGELGLLVYTLNLIYNSICDRVARWGILLLSPEDRATPVVAISVHAPIATTLVGCLAVGATGLWAYRAIRKAIEIAIIFRGER